MFQLVFSVHRNSGDMDFNASEGIDVQVRARASRQSKLPFPCLFYRLPAHVKGDFPHLKIGGLKCTLLPQRSGLEVGLPTSND